MFVSHSAITASSLNARLILIIHVSNFIFISTGTQHTIVDRKSLFYRSGLLKWHLSALAAVAFHVFLNTKLRMRVTDNFAVRQYELGAAREISHAAHDNSVCFEPHQLKLYLVNSGMLSNTPISSVDVNPGYRIFLISF